MNITFFYTAILAILFVVLSLRTIRLRRKLKISVGDAGNLHMLRAVRVHSNFSEYVPLSLLLIYFVEMKTTSAIFVHALGFSLLFGRIVHAFGLGQVEEDFRFRVFGMAITLTVILSCAGFLIFSFF